MTERRSRKRTSPTLSWPGRKWEAGAPDAEVSRIEIEETIPAATLGGHGRLIRGDALTVARALLREGLGGGADLVYVDPPFASQCSYVHEARLDGSADGRVVRTPAYSDSWGKRSSRPHSQNVGERRAAKADDGVGEYLDMLAPRLEAASRLVAPTGTLWVHLDWRAAYLVRVLLDEILGRDHFLNEIVWRRAPNLGRQATSAQFGRTLDTLLVYGGPRARLEPPTRLEPVEKSSIRWDEQGRPFTSAPRGDYTDASIERLAAVGRVHRTASGKVYIKYFLVKDEGGLWCRERRVDTLWTDVPPLRHSALPERTGFPTQKPRALLDRIVRCASSYGGLVIDLFAGSGTTGEAALASGRRFILGDSGPVAISTARARLLRAGATLSIGRVSGAYPPEGPKPVVRASSNFGGIEIELVAPREPLAWAVDPSYDRCSSFRAAWHAERRPGAKTVPANAVASIEAARGPVAVRVFGDDGTISTSLVDEIDEPQRAP